MNTEASLRMFYKSDRGPSVEDRLAAASRRAPSKPASCGCGCGSATEDAIDWKEHVRRYHGGSFDPKVDKCDIYDRMMKSEEDLGLLSHEDADGDGNRDDY